MTCAGALGAAAARRSGRVAFRLAWSCAAQRGALCRHDWPTVAQKQKSPPRQCRGRAWGREAFDATG